MLRVCFVGLAVFLVSSHAMDNGVARTPPMGWCSWNFYHRLFNSTVFMEAADAMAENGMRELGYEYINVDGGWWAGSDTGTIVRNATGYVQVNPDKYPNGIQPVIDYVHSKGFKYGHYTDSGTAACNGDKPMSEGYEKQDVALFVSWGIDMIKVDACHRTESAETVMDRWHTLLNATGRSVLLSDCHNGCETGEWEPWCASANNMWRSSSDIRATWDSFLHNLDTLKGRGAFGKPGAWNDPDFLEVGIQEFADDGSTRALNMNRAHFSMWTITSSPLIAGVPLGNATSAIIKVLTNKAAIDVNQAYAGNAGDLVKVLVPGSSMEGGELWAKPLPDDSAAVILFNRFDNKSVAMSAPLSDIPGIPANASSCKSHHVWDGIDSVVTSVSATPAPRSVEYVVLSECT